MTLGVVSGGAAADVMVDGAVAGGVVAGGAVNGGVATAGGMGGDVAGAAGVHAAGTGGAVPASAGAACAGAGAVCASPLGGGGDCGRLGAVAAASSAAATSAADLARNRLAADDASDVGEGARESQSSPDGGVCIALPPGDRFGSEAPDRGRSGGGFAAAALSRAGGCTEPPGARAGKKPRRT